MLNNTVETILQMSKQYFKKIKSNFAFWQRKSVLSNLQTNFNTLLPKRVLIIFGIYFDDGDLSLHPQRGRLHDQKRVLSSLIYLWMRQSISL